MRLLARGSAMSERRVFVVHLVKPHDGLRHTRCGLSASVAECLPEGDHLSPYERLCAKCAHPTPKKEEKAR